MSSIAARAVSGRFISNIRRRKERVRGLPAIESIFNDLPKNHEFVQAVTDAQQLLQNGAKATVEARWLSKEINHGYVYD